MILSMQRPPVNKNPRAIRGLRFVVTAAAVYWILRRAELEGVGAALASAAIAPLLGGIGIYVVGQAVCALRWMRVARANGFIAGFAEFLRNYYIGMFFNLFGPATLGGDLVRSLYLAGSGGRRVAALHTVLSERLVGLFWLLAVACAAMAVFGTFGIPAPIVWAAVVLSAGLAGVMLLGPHLVGALLPAGGRARDFLENEVRFLWQNPRVLGEASALSVLFHLIQLGAIVAVGRSAGVEIPWQGYLVMHPLVTTFGALPVSLAGLGLREAGYVYFLTTVWAVPATEAVAFAILWLVVIVSASAVGGVVFLIDRRKFPVADGFSRVRSSFRRRRKEL
jgi:uncharacterized membrane protein YbhN (UPF0104 family)